MAGHAITFTHLMGRLGALLSRRDGAMTEHQAAGPGRVLAAYVGGLVGAQMTLATVLTPLLPHYAQLAGLSKSGAGFLMAADPAGSLLGSLPGGMITGRLGPR